MDLKFPVPKITESFMDLVVESIGGSRLTEKEKNHEQSKNADYLFMGGVGELKVIEEEPLEKKERQDRIAKEFSEKYQLPPEVDLNIKRMNDFAKADYKELVGVPIKKAVKKAARQIDATKRHLGRALDYGLLIAVNNGFASLPHDEFDNLVLTYCRKETSQIDFILCTTVEYHQGSFDSYVFCYTEGYSVHGGIENFLRKRFQKAVVEEFNKRMTEVMRNQVEFMQKGKDLLEPVSDIRFDRDGVVFVRNAPKVPDSRFMKTTPK